jgi:hypothetical protein
MEQRIGGGLLQLRWQVPAERMEDFNRWYDEEHLGDLVAVPGILGARRFARVATWKPAAPSDFQYLTLYQLASEEALAREEFVAHGRNPSPWTQRAATDLPMARGVYRQIFPEVGVLTGGGVGPPERQAIGRAILHVMMESDPSCAEDFNRWYNEEHVPSLVAAPGVLGGRRFLKLTSGALGGAGDEPESSYPYLAMYELEDETVAQSAAFREAGRATPWRLRLADRIRAHAQVYRQIFPAEGALEASG